MNETNGERFRVSELSSLLTLLVLMLCGLGPVRAWAGLAAAQAAVRAGNTKFFQQDYAGAETNFAAAISADPTWAVPYNNRGLARFHRGDFNGADADFEAAKSRETNYVAAFLNKGKSLAAQKRFAEAAAELEAGLLLAPQHAALHHSLGWVYDEQGRHAGARQQYAAALSLDPAEHGVRLARGISYARENLVTEAEHDFYAVINGAHGTLLEPMAAYNLQLLRGPGVAFADTAAAADFAEAIFAFSTGQHTAALAWLQAARTNAPSVPDIPWIMGWTQLKQRDSGSADVHLAEAYALMQHVPIYSAGPSPYALSADIFLNGIKRGRTPATLPLFASSYDLVLRAQVGTEFWEWTGRIQTDAASNASEPMRFRMVQAPATLTPAGPFADADRDGLADEWELRHFGHLGAAPGEDSDTDGLLNVHEQWMSSSPRDTDSDDDGVPDREEFAVSLLQIATLRVSGGVCSIRFPARREFQYVVDRSEAVHGAPWTEIIGSRVTGNDSIMEVADMNPGAGSTRFYRVRLDLLPQRPERLVWIPPGTFIMGSPESEAERYAANEIQHQVTITRGFWMGKYEVTQAEFLEIMGGNPSWFNGYQPQAGTNYGTDLNRPVDSVSWYDAATYCALLTRRERAAWRLPVGYVYRLPTEAEWEYACRAGTTTAFHYGNALRSGMENTDGRIEYDSAVGTINNPSGTCLLRTVAVGSYAPNPWGLYDMHGNVAEWCYDQGGAQYTSESVTDPTGPTEGGSYCVFRGGHWCSIGKGCRSAGRTWTWRDDERTEMYRGFRVVLAAEGSALMVPRIMKQPESQLVMPGSPASFWTYTDYASQGIPGTVQWLLNGTNVAGQTSGYLQIASVQPSDAGEYVAIFCNDYGSARTAPATLRLATPATISREPESEEVLAGATVRFSVAVPEATGYQWHRDGIALPGATNRTLTLAGVTLADSGVYQVVVSCGNTPVASRPAALRVVVLPRITSQPQSVSVAVGSYVRFSVTVEISGTLRYQWTFEGTDLPGATNAALTLTNVQSPQAGAYRVAVANMAGEVVSDPAILTVLLPVVITEQPRHATVAVGETVVLRAVATGTTPIGVRWRKNGATLIPFATLPGDLTVVSSLVLSNVVLSNGGTYQGVFTNLVNLSGIATTNAQVTVVLAPGPLLVQAGATVSLQATAFGATPVGLGWAYEGTALGGYNNFRVGSYSNVTTLTLTNVQPAQGGEYVTWVTNKVGQWTPFTNRLTIAPGSGGGP